QLQEDLPPGADAGGGGRRERSEVVRAREPAHRARRVPPEHRGRRELEASLDEEAVSLLYAMSSSGRAGGDQPGNSGAVDGNARWRVAISLKSARKSVVMATSRPSKRCSGARPGQRP